MNSTAIHSAHSAHIGIAAIEDSNSTAIPNVSRKESGIEGPNGTHIQGKTSTLKNGIPPTPESNSQVPTNEDALPPEIHDFDMLIIGAGISGINMAYRYQESFPNGNYIVLEQR